MIALAFLAYSALIFFLGVKHERSCTFWLHQPGPFVPHRPRLLTSPHWPHRVGDHTRGVVGADSSRGNDVL